MQDKHPNAHFGGFVNAVGYIDPNEPNRDFDPTYRHSHAHGDGHCCDCNSTGHAHRDHRDSKPDS